MDESHTFFRQLVEQFPLEFHNVSQVGQEWKIGTNKGDKRLNHFSSQHQLALSHDWREYLADNGYRYVERYLATRDGKRALEDPTGPYVLSDYWEEREWPEERKKRWEGYFHLGNILAKTHFFFDARGGEKETIPLNFQKKGIMARIRFQSLYEFLHRIAQEKQKWPLEIRKFFTANLPHLAERIHKAELFYQRSLDEPTFYSFSQLPLQCLVWSKEKWYLVGNHHPFISPLHEDTFTLIIQINQREKGEMKGVESFLKGYMAEREISRKEWDFICSMFIFPWGVMERLQVLMTKKQPQDIQSEELKEIFVNQIEQEGLLQFIAQWLDSRDGVSI